jgi:ribose transport system permease protein
MMLALSSATVRLRRYPWILSFVGSACAFIAIEVVSHHFSLQNLTINLGLAGFLTIAALGQMFAITGGGGGIDLSVPQVLTLSAMASAAITHGHAGLTFSGTIAALAVGVVAGIANGGLVVIVRLPPIVATLASGFVMESLIQIFYPQAEAGGPSQQLATFVHGHFLGLPAMLWVAVVATIVIGGILQRSIFGRRLEAVGQNQRAAGLVGIHVLRIRFLSYVVSGFMAAVTGLLLAAYAGGAFLDMGTSYQLGSIAAVVLGGSLIAGGRSTATGVFGGAVLLTFLVTLMGVSGLSAGLQDILEGVIIVLVISLRRGQ